MDLVQRQGKTVTITDHKRQWNIMSETDMRARLQFQLYASIAFAHHPDALRVVVRVYYIRYGTVKEVTFLPEEVARIPDTVRAIDAARNLFLTNESSPDVSPSAHCKLCPIAPTCPGIIQEENEFIVPKTMQEAKLLADRISIYNRFLSDAKTALKEFSAAHGDIPTQGGKAYGFVASKDPEWESSNFEALVMLLDDLEAAGVLKEINFQPEAIIKENGKGIAKLAKLLRQYGDASGSSEAFEQLSMLAHPKTKTTFREHKV